MRRIVILIIAFLSIAISADAQRKCQEPGGDDKQLPPPPHPQDPLDDTSTSGGISADPNEIIGPTGYDDSLRWVSINDVLNYTIFFENDPDFATANAQKVDVRFNFADKAAMKGFGLGTYGFANQSWNIEDAPAAYQNRLDLRDSMYIYVDLTAGIDVVKQQAFWLFNSIDPETGYNPWQVDRGMLPVNDSTHVGEGFVTFRLKPQEDLKTGDTISIVASIVFDQNDTIPTNRWRNTIDAGMPTSKVNGRKDSKNENLYHLTLQAADDEGGSGLRRVLLYQANNFGIYEEVATCPIDTVIDFMAEPGHQYRFYSIAEDNVGNREPLKEQPDLIININAAPTDIALSDSTFQDDIAAGGFIAELTSEDIEQDGTFTYALAEGDGAIHNDLFQITGTQLQAKQQFKCAEDTVYQIRLSTTDAGGLSFSKTFKLDLRKVLEKPKADTLNVTICEGDVYDFYGKDVEKAGLYRYSKSNDYMCDSLFVLNLSVAPPMEAPVVTVEGEKTLVSSAQKGNQWYRDNGIPVQGATEQKFTPEEDGVYYVCVKNGNCVSAASKSYIVRQTFKTSITLNMAKGWNWVSSNLKDEKWSTALQFLSPIAEQTSRLLSQTSELINDPQFGLVGNLSSLNPQEGYKLQLTEAVSNTWQGEAYNPRETPVQLSKGWNWIGFVPMEESTLDIALSEITPLESDQIMCEDDFSVFDKGQWVGSLTTLQPGRGYMYYAGQDSKLLFPAKKVFEVIEAEPANARVMNMRRLAPWQYDEHLYPDNTTMIARLMVNGASALAGTYTVGAFCDNECCGVGKYVDDNLFITVHGIIGKGQQITFRAYENATGQEYNINETVVFNGQREGTIAIPYTLHVNTSTGIEGTTAQGYTVYPRPLRSRLYMNGDTGNIKSIKVLAGDGAVSIVQNGYPADGIDVSALLPGVYVVAIITNEGSVYYEKVMKAGK